MTKLNSEDLKNVSGGIRVRTDDEKEKILNELDEKSKKNITVGVKPHYMVDVEV